ncbi:MAG: FMN-binding protein [Spirochaetaceae bacterium]
MLKDLKMILFLVILSSTSILLLAYVNTIYLGFEGERSLDLYRLIMDKYQISYGDDVLDTFSSNFNIITRGDRKYFVSQTNRSGSVVLVREGPGLWSILELLIIVQSDLKSLESITVLSQGETPGLGGRVTEREFLDQFENILVRPQLSIVKRAKKDNEVDAISGATATSKGVEDIINIAISFLDKDIREELNVPE